MDSLKQLWRAAAECSSENGNGFCGHQSCRINIGSDVRWISFNRLHIWIWMWTNRTQFRVVNFGNVSNKFHTFPFTLNCTWSCLWLVWCSRQSIQRLLDSTAFEACSGLLGSPSSWSWQLVFRTWKMIPAVHKRMGSQYEYKTVLLKIGGTTGGEKTQCPIWSLAWLIMRVIWRKHHLCVNLNWIVNSYLLWDGKMDLE